MRANLRLRLENSEQNVAVVHQVLLGFGELLGLDALELDDLDTAVTEACKNVVWHAYDGAEGPLELELYALEGAVRAVVRDEGIGIRPRPGEHREHHTGIGLPLIHVRSRRVTYTNLPTGGTEVAMEFEMPLAVALEPAAAAPEERARELQDVEFECSPPPLASVVLPRLLRALWLAAGLPPAAAPAVANVSDALLAAVAAGPAPDALRLCMRSVEGALELSPAGVEERGEGLLESWRDSREGPRSLRVELRAGTVGNGGTLLRLSATR